MRCRGGLSDARCLIDLQFSESQDDHRVCLLFAKLWAQFEYTRPLAIFLASIPWPVSCFDEFSNEILVANHYWPVLFVSLEDPAVAWHDVEVNFGQADSGG